MRVEVREPAVRIPAYVVALLVTILGGIIVVAVRAGDLNRQVIDMNAQLQQLSDRVLNIERRIP